MSEELKTPITPKEETKAEIPAPVPSLEELREAAFKWLNEAPPEEILRHTRVGGIVGQRMQANREQVRQEEQAKASEQARRETEAEFERLANEDPAEFSRKFLSAREKERLLTQQNELSERIQQDFASGIGDAFKALPEWQDLTPEEFAKLQTALVGKQGKEVLSAFTVTAADIVADRKAAKRLADYRERELPKEREAIRTEEAAKRLQSSERPDVMNGASTRTKFDPTKMNDKEFDTWYRKNQLGRV